MFYLQIALSRGCLSLNLKVHSHYTGINVCECIRSHTLIDVRGTLDIRLVRSKYADIRRCLLCYQQRLNYFLDMFKLYQHLRAYSIYLTLLKRLPHARHMLDTLDIRSIRQNDASGTLFICYTNDVNTVCIVCNRLSSIARF